MLEYQKLKLKELGIPVPNTIWILPKSFEQLSSLDGLFYESDMIWFQNYFGKIIFHIHCFKKI